MYQNPRMVATVEESAHFYEAFPAAGGPYCTENTLYMSLLVSRCWQSDPGRFERLLEIQAGSTRLREWGHHFPNDEARAGALAAVRAHFEAEGATARSRMENGMELEATLMRRGLPFAIDARTKPAPGWLQICQRVSQSEDGLARWEVSGADPAVARAAREAIERIVREFGAGPEYVG
jgi:phosphomannomutase